VYDYPDNVVMPTQQPQPASSHGGRDGVAMLQLSAFSNDKKYYSYGEPDGEDRYDKIA